MPDAPHFIYFADPMCSWCYGFSPVMGALARQFEGRLPVRVVMGGAAGDVDKVDFSVGP